MCQNVRAITRRLKKTKNQKKKHLNCCLNNVEREDSNENLPNLIEKFTNLILSGKFLDKMRLKCYILFSCFKNALENITGKCRCSRRKQE